MDENEPNRTSAPAEPSTSSPKPANPRPWKWNKKREEAVTLLAEDELTDREIAEKLKIGRTALATWKHVPEFAARIEELRKTLGNVARRRAIGRVARRVKDYDDRKAALEQVIAERGADEKMQQVPGGKTGLLVRQVKGIGKGEDYQVVEEFVVDGVTLRELRELEKQAAQELGQWTEKSEVTADQVTKVYLFDPTKPERDGTQE